MVNYKSFYKFLLNNKLITPIWEYVLDMIEQEIIICNKNTDNKDYYLIIFSMYFSLICDGNICISLDKETLLKKWNVKINASKILLEDSEDYDSDEFDEYDIVVKESIDKVLSSINESTLPEIIGEDKFFVVCDGFLYLRKYHTARLGVINSMDRIFSKTRELFGDNNTSEILSAYKYPLSLGQAKAVNDGVYKNLIVTGGPGTGKTTSILFLLLNILKNDSSKRVNLVAPSGKAAGRMKESIIKCLKDFSIDFKNKNAEVINQIETFKNSTIHSLLGINHETNGFMYNKYNQFDDNSIFVIDESSMVDICLFNSLLEAIPSSSYVYILGDKNQLPSVDCGAVFGDLLKKKSLENNIIELDESIRFKKGTKIYELAYKINNGLDIKEDEIIWKDYNEFKIEEDDDSKPIYYYHNYKVGHSDKEIIEFVINIWGKKYYKDLQNMASDLDYNDYKKLDELFNTTEVSRVLCAENKGVRGISSINKYIREHFVDKSKPTSIYGYYPGMLIMISKNNKILDLYNGDSGVLVTFKDDPVLYLMVRKDTELNIEEGKKEDKIFKFNGYIYYPLRLLASNEFDLAYAITIHKSQGSDYQNILVILPTKKGHPLLNRQIVYTAITRTKGNTYILSNYDRLVEAKDTILIRDTNII